MDDSPDRLTEETLTARFQHALRADKATTHLRAAITESLNDGIGREDLAVLLEVSAAFVRAGLDLENKKNRLIAELEGVASDEDDRNRIRELAATALARAQGKEPNSKLRVNYRTNYVHKALKEVREHRDTIASLPVERAEAFSVRVTFAENISHEDKLEIARNTLNDPRYMGGTRSLPFFGFGMHTGLDVMMHALDRMLEEDPDTAPIVGELAEAVLPVLDDIRRASARERDASPLDGDAENVASPPNRDSIH
ncbi:MAG: hypothetical protein AB7L94_32350 [Kofleriaceae bacterium]